MPRTGSRAIRRTRRRPHSFGGTRRTGPEFEPFDGEPIPQDDLGDDRYANARQSCGEENRQDQIFFRKVEFGAALDRTTG